MGCGWFYGCVLDLYWTRVDLCWECFCVIEREYVYTYTLLLPSVHVGGG